MIRCPRCDMPMWLLDVMPDIYLCLRCRPLRPLELDWDNNKLVASTLKPTSKP